MKDSRIVEVVKKIIEQELVGLMPSSRPIPVGVSGRHLHITREDLDVIFGKDYQLTEDKPLTQPGQYAAKERVTLVGPRGVIENVRILGPVRSRTQVEISFTDARRLGLNPPIRDSGDLDGTPGITIVGPAGSVTIPEGVIIAKRHIHMTPDDAEEYKVVDGEIVRVVCGDKRKLIFDEVLIRVSENYRLDFHIDFDEANAAGVKTGDLCYLLKKNGEVKVPEKREVIRRLVTEADVREAEEKGLKIMLVKGTIITPLALELGLSKGVIIDRR